MQEVKSLVQAGIRNRYKLHLLDFISKKYQEEFTYNISQYIKSIQNSSIEVSLSSSDLDKFVYRMEYALNNLDVKLNPQDQSSILNAIKSKYLSLFPSEDKEYASFYLSRPSKDIWQIYTSPQNSNLLSNIMQDEIEEMFLKFILDKISEA